MGDKPTELQEEILRTKSANPDWSNEEIAQEVGTRKGHVTKTLNQYDTSEISSDGSVAGLIGFLLLTSIIVLIIVFAIT